MKRKQNNDKQKASKTSNIESGDNTLSKYSNEEISSAYTLVSIMTNERFDESVSQVVDVVNPDNDVVMALDNTSKVNGKDGISEVKEFESTPQTSPPKSTSDQNIEIQETNDSEPKSTSLSYTTLPVSSSQSAVNGNHCSYYGNPYGYHPMDPYGYSSQYIPMYSMPTNFGPMSSRQCMYCGVISPPITSMPTHSTFPMPYNMATEPPKKMAEPFGVNSIPGLQPQVVSTPIPVSSLYPYYQIGPKVTSACVSPN